MTSPCLSFRPSSKTDFESFMMNHLWRRGNILGLLNGELGVKRMETHFELYFRRDGNTARNRLEQASISWENDHMSVNLKNGAGAFNISDISELVQKLGIMQIQQEPFKI